MKVEKKNNTQVEIWKRGKRSKHSYFRKAELPTARIKDNQVRNKGTNTQYSKENEKRKRVIVADYKMTIHVVVCRKKIIYYM